MNEHHSTAGGAAAAQNPPAPSDGLVGARLGRRVRDLLVAARPSGLVLHGWVDRYRVKQLARHTATAVTGLPVLADRIEPEHLRAGAGPSVPVVLLTRPSATPPGSGSGGAPPVVSVLDKSLAVGTLLGAVRSAVVGVRPPASGGRRRGRKRLRRRPDRPGVG